MHTPAVGIVAEYNPLHRGHSHHIEQARLLSGADSVVAVMSPDFVQRGQPALLDKWTRTEMALSAGVDLVLELPVVFASHNAGVFANAAVDILAATGILTHISYGAETPCWQFDRILDILIEEPEPFKFCLKDHLKKGFSFVEARSIALEELIPGSAQELKKSNNSLALSYMLRIRQKKYDLIPVPVQRIGADYNDTTLSEFSSASGIRKRLEEGDIKRVLTLMPPSSADLLRTAVVRGRACIDFDPFWKNLRAMLLRAAPEEIAGFAEMGEGIENRLRREALESETFDEWASKCASKRYPKGRIQRQAIHFLLGLEHWTNRAFQRVGPAYIRVLGMNEKGRILLHRMRGKTSLPVITRCGAAESEYARKMMSLETLSAELWESFVSKPEYGREHTRKVIIRE